MRLLIYLTLGVALAGAAIFTISERAKINGSQAGTRAQPLADLLGAERLWTSTASSGGPGSRADDRAEPTSAREAALSESESPLTTGDAFIRAGRDDESKSARSSEAPAAEFVDEQGNVYRGRDAVIEAASEGFSRLPDAQFVTKIESIRFVSPTVAIEDGTTTLNAASVQPIRSHYTVVHVKTGGKWWVASMRETPATVGE